MPKFSRRDFLKLAGALPVGYAAGRLQNSLGLQAAQKNVVIVVFDAFSAYHMSLYGYGRQTTPNIARLAERSIVYHNHYAASNYTTPGTASLLTGAYPWTNRAMPPNSAVSADFENRSIFAAFDGYHRMGYSHNEWVNTLFDGFRKHIDEWMPKDALFLPSSDAFIQKVFENDRDISSVGWTRNTKIQEEGYAYSLFLSRVISTIEAGYLSKYLPQYPRGLPTARGDNGFVLSDAIDWLAQRLPAASKPLFGYFHFLPPHDPYRPERTFAGAFRNDGYPLPEKPRDLFANEEADLYPHRNGYDEFILNVDYEFGRLFESLESSGILEDTLLVLTSDHGEMFERGIKGHMTNAMYQPLLRVPLLIFDPSIKERVDIHETTSAVDLLPTLAHWAGLNIPDWTEGGLLPPYRKGGSETAAFAIRSHATTHDAPIRQASTSIARGRYKLHYYFGYPELGGQELVKLFDVQNDPGEMTDLSLLEKEVASKLLEELKSKIAAANVLYL